MFYDTTLLLCSCGREAPIYHCRQLFERRLMIYGYLLLLYLVLGADGSEGVVFLLI